MSTWYISVCRSEKKVKPILICWRRGHYYFTNISCWPCACECLHTYIIIIYRVVNHFCFEWKLQRYIISRNKWKMSEKNRFMYFPQNERAQTLPITKFNHNSIWLLSYEACDKQLPLWKKVQKLYNVSRNTWKTVKIKVLSQNWMFRPFEWQKI